MARTEMAAIDQNVELLPVLSLLAAAVVAGPLFKRLGFGSVLGYLAAGIVVGPFGLQVMSDPTTILHVAELGIVLFLFVIGLEMRPSRLWGLRKQIFGLGLVQVLCCMVLLTAISMADGTQLLPAFIAGTGFVLTSTAIVMQILEDRRQISSEGGQQIVSILLLEDLAIVPLLAVVGFLSQANEGAQTSGVGWAGIATGVFAIAGVVISGRYLLNPLFRVLASARSRDVMTAAALLVVLGAAYVMQLGGLSMAMGAFLAGVLLAESSFRNQLEVEVEPFRSILLGLFFLAVGMSLDLSVIRESWRSILLHVASYMVVKATAIYWIARLFGSQRREAMGRAVIMAQGGEFAFVLYSAAAAAGLIDARQSAEMTSVVIVSMMITPVVIALVTVFERRSRGRDSHSEQPKDLSGNVLIIGFGRVGQIASQLLLHRGHTISIIDTDVEMIDVAREFGFRVYYGDGTRLDVLHAAGAGRARAVLVCVDKAEDSTRIVSLLRSEFPGVRIIARSIDRRHSIQLIGAGADFHVRETFESAVLLGGRTLQALGASDAEIATTTARIRDRDNERMHRELMGGRDAGRALFSGPEAPEFKPE